MKKTILCLSLIAICLAANARFFFRAPDYNGLQNDPTNFTTTLLATSSDEKTSSYARVTFVPNGNQWEKQVKYQADIRSGRAFFTDHGVTYSYYNTNDLIRIHNEEDNIETTEVDRAAHSDQVQCYAFKVNFVGCSVPKLSGENKAKYNVNYF